MHGTFKSAKALKATPVAPDEKLDTPVFTGPDAWLLKAMHDPNGDPLRQLFSPSSK